MHNKKAIHKEIVYLQTMHDSLMKKAVQLQNKFLYSKDTAAGEEAAGYFEVCREYSFKISALRWVIEKGPFHRLPT